MTNTWTAPAPTGNVLVDALWTTVADFANRAQDAYNVVAAHESDDAAKMLEAMRPSHTDWPKVEKLQAQIATLLAKIDADNAPNVEKPSEKQVANARVELETIHAQVAPTVKLLAANVENFDAKESMPEVLRKRMPRASGSGGSSTPKPRVSTIVLSDLRDESGDTFTRSFHKGAEHASERATFTNAAQTLSRNAKEGDISTGDLQQHYFAAVGEQTKDEKAKSGDTSGVAEGTVTEFAVTIGAQHYNVKVVK